MRGASAAAAAVLIAAAAISGCLKAPSSAPAAGHEPAAGLQLTPLNESSLTAFRDAFDEASDRLRYIAILFPT